MKFLVRAESPRDFADLLFSWKHIPNICIYDFARGLATHANLRRPGAIPFTPFEGRLAESTDDNIKAARAGELSVDLPWLREKGTTEAGGHPVTGSSQHYVLYDRFHEANSRDPRDALRRLQLVPELAGQVNTQVAEQLFGDMRRNNYYLNMMSPSTHIFMVRSLIQVHNDLKNQAMRHRIAQALGPQQNLGLDGLGRLIIGKC